MHLGGVGLRVAGTRHGISPVNTSNSLLMKRGGCKPARYRRGAGDGGNGEEIVLYTSLDTVHGGLDPQSQAVKLALVEKQLPFREIKVAPGARPEEFSELYHSIVPDRAARERVPLLLDGPQRLVDAGVIVAFLAEAHAGSGAPLVPANPYAAARVKLFSLYFAEHVVPAYAHLVAATEPAAIADAREALMRALAAVDEFLALHGASEGRYAVGQHYGWTMRQPADQQSDDGVLASEEPQGAPDGGGHYFLGRLYTVAEVLATPYVARLVQVLPEWRGIDVLAECEAASLHRVAAWMRACLERPSAKLTTPGQQELMEGLVSSEWSHAL